MTTLNLFKSGPIVYRDTLTRDLRNFIATNNLAAYYRPTDGYCIIAERENLLLNYVVAKKHRLTKIENNRSTFEHNGVDWVIVGVSVDWFCSYFMTQTFVEMEDLKKSIVQIRNCHTIMEMATVFHDYLHLLSVDVHYVRVPLEELIDMTEELFRYKNVRTLRRDMLIDENINIERFIDACMTNQFPACIHVGDDLVIVARTESDLVEYIRQKTSAVFIGLNAEKIPTWQIVKNDDNDSDFIDSDVDSDDDSDDDVAHDRWYVLGLSSIGYEALLRLGDIDVANVTNGTSCCDIKDLAMELYLMVNTNSTLLWWLY